MSFVGRYLRRYPALATAVYFVGVITLLVAAGMAIVDLYGRYAALAEAIDTLDQLQGRKQRPTSNTGSPGVLSPTGSPVLDGPTVTVAGASLLQHVSAAVTRVGGDALSSQVDLQGTQSKDGFVSVTVNCEIEQAALQKLLYDIESGMPFLFIDQLSVQTPTGSSSAAGGRLRVVLAVSGQWQGSK